ncbi:MAG TPA: hypothetical protein VKA58_03700, partial [Propionibacteriaceae bacterium]|nr:hypothetical protein [Propionibacteriaceae bacterium]
NSLAEGLPTPPSESRLRAAMSTVTPAGAPTVTGSIGAADGSRSGYTRSELGQTGKTIFDVDGGAHQWHEGIAGPSLGGGPYGTAGREGGVHHRRGARAGTFPRAADDRRGHGRLELAAEPLQGLPRLQHVPIRRIREVDVYRAGWREVAALDRGHIKPLHRART